MTIAELIDAMIAELGMMPTREQREALATLGSFLADRNEQSVMVMRGSAGTGKTTLAGAMVRTLKRLGQRIVLLAPTGRAAKVFSLNSGFHASTIHRKIYRQKTFAGDFNLSYNASTDTLFLVDEASMIGMDLLNDLVKFVYSGRNCRMMLIGDQAQLPPVGEEESPALSVPVLRLLGLDIYQSALTEVLRQSQESGILFNATRIRMAEAVLPRIRFKGFADIVPVSGNELIECLEQSYRQVGMDETMIVTRSNKRSNIYNMGIRNTILDREELLETGDMLMVVKNRYLQGVAGASGVSGVAGVSEVTGVTGVDFIANGDRARVLRVRHQRELYGFHFADVWLQFPDYDNWEWQTTVITDSLTSEAPALTAEQQELLYNKVMEDYADVRPKSERIRRLKEDIYFNALQVKFGYAVTCHKAQGGQWAHVYVDQGVVNAVGQLSPREYLDYIRWLYTAFTRATERLYLVNWPEAQMHNVE
ncbi:MAG: AAA family ATPase [Prevotella sp.]|nr:AAA family ATPase [Prevotella sp.]